MNAFGLDDSLREPGPRGADGQIWRLGPYALKEIFTDPPDQRRLAAELDLAARARDAGILLPAGHPAPDGRYLVPSGEGTWLRLYDWVDLRPLDPPDPVALGELLAKLHRCAPRADGPVGDWYETGSLPWLTPSDPATLILCHRDLHPENVWAGPTVIDWGDTGPADPSRELARMMFDWFYEEPVFDVAAMRALHEAYVAAGGPGRVTGPADFTMLMATRLNFRATQIRLLDDPRHRAWAERELAESERILPTRRHLDAVLDAL